MNSKIRRRLHNRRTSGISEVVGAMLLMIVVVVAVGTFAYYLNNLQNSTQNRQNFQNNIANDKLQITQIQFTLNNSQIRYEMVFTSNHTIRFWIQIVSNTTVQLINETTGHLAHLANLNSSSSLTSTPGPFNQAYYNSINFSTSAVLYSLHDSRPLWNISFIPSTASVPGNYTFRTASWSNATVSVRNLNTQNLLESKSYR